MSHKTYLARCFGGNPEGTTEGLRKTIELLDAHESAVIVVPKLSGLDISMLAKILGDAHSKMLIENRDIKFTDGKTLKLCNESSIDHHRNDELFLALWCKEQGIKNIEKLPNLKTLVVVTWNYDDESYISSTNIETIYDDSQES